MRVPQEIASNNLFNAFKQKILESEAVPYNEFMQWALYHPEFGYYQQNRQRVGKFAECDFYTSRSLGTLWGNLIISSCVDLIGSDQISNYSFVEIGAETGQKTLDGISELPFSTVDTICLNKEITIPSQAVVFCNEWLDAQPFRRFSFSSSLGRWVELGVSFEKNKLIEVIFSDRVEDISVLPPKAEDGYIIDWPSGSISALQSLITGSDWKGLFLTFDYGLPLQTILQDRPAGTARAYRNQKLSSDLLLTPGSQDLTCHLCWDVLEGELRQSGFEKVVLQTQESFLLNHAVKYIQNVFAQKKEGLDDNMLALRELIHPAHLGHGLQALWGIRT